ncbi:MAG: hypothetical protein K8F27_11780 [Sulfuricellaceae bacterium]|nr:hypothetical protein [Sulfuricellaceae bacterium]
MALNLNRAKELGMWLHERTNGLNLPQNDRIRIGGTVLHLALEHYDAIIVLIDARLYGSAFSLARLLLEAYVRGAWLLNVASDTERQSYMKGKCPDFYKLLDAIGDDPETGGAWIKGTKEKNWTQFNELTHGGACHVIRRNTEEAIESAYPEEELSRLLEFSGEVAIRVAAELFAVADDELLLTQLAEKAAIIRGHPNRLA